MDGISKTKQQLLQENRDLTIRLAESEDILEAIRTGAVDALVVSDAQGEKIFTLQSADYSYRVMAESMNEGAVTIDKKGIIVFTNKAFADLAQRKMPILVGARFRDFVSRSHHRRFTAFLKECASRPRRAQFSIAGSRGAAIPVSISGTNFEIGGKRSVSLIVSDLRERKEAEQKLRDAYAQVERKVVERTVELHQSREEFRTLSENSPDSIERFGTDLRNLYVNSVASKIYGMDITGKTWREAGFPQDFIAFWEERFNSVIHTGKVENVESRYQSPDGADYVLSSTIAPEFDDDGNMRSVLIVSRDITESKRVAKALLHNIRQLSEANKDLGSFSLSVMHDLRNPLQAIVSCLSVLSVCKKEINEDEQIAIEYINTMTERISQVIKDLVSLSHISMMDLRSATVELSAVAHDLINEIQASDPRHEVEVIIMPGITAGADKNLVRILLDNLLRNAWKFSSKSDPARIEFGTTLVKEQLVYFVRDNGVGFDMASAGLMFEPFTRFHSRKEFSGSGIGLSMVKRIVQRHGGAIWADSAPGKGATFYFTLASDDRVLS
jgi:PAS domain S-box-containing protein